MQRRWLSTVITAAFCLPLTGLAAADFVPNQVVVQWKGDDQRVSTLNVSHVRTAIQLLKQDTRVAWVEPNFKRALAEATPDDPYLGAAYHLATPEEGGINAEKAWAATTGSREVVVAVIDSGVDIEHPDLVENIWTNPDEIADNGLDDDQNGYVDDVHGWDVIQNDANPSPRPAGAVWDEVSVSHGTHVAGIIGAVGNNAEGVTGVNWSVSIMPIRTINARGKTDVNKIVNAIHYATDNGADVINLSFGAYHYSKVEAAAIKAATDQGIIVVAAAGNSAYDLGNDPFYPACYANVVAVAASNAQSELAGFSNFGHCIDITAPGSNVISTIYQGAPELGFVQEYGFMSGTSMASPVVAGAAALLRAERSTITPTKFVTLVSSTADAMEETGVGGGRLNLNRAMQALTKTVESPDAVSIQGFTSDDSHTALATSVRTNSSLPYFSWKTEHPKRNRGYYVYFGTDADANPVLAGYFRHTSNFQPDHAVEANEETYYLRVVAIGKTGRKSSVSQYAYLPDTTVKAPVWDTATLKDAGLTLIWDAPEGEHVVHYAVYRSSQRVGPYSQVAYRITNTQFTDTTANTGQVYFYRLKATDDFGNESNFSQILRVEL